MAYRNDKSLLTKTHKDLIQYLATCKDKVAIFEGDSLSGSSWTLRYRRDWIDYSRWGAYPRYMTSHIFSVVIPIDQNKRDIAYNRYKAMVIEATNLFNEIRQGNVS